RTNERLGAEIADRTRAERELERNRTMIEQVLNSVPLLIWWKDLNLNFLGSNWNFAVQAGFASPKELVESQYLNLNWREHAKKFADEDQAVIAGGQPLMNILDRLSAADGSMRWYNTIKAPLKDAQGRIYGVLGVAQDISERKASEELLRQERHFTNALI